MSYIKKICFLSYFITNIVTVLPDTSTHKFAPRCHLIFFFFDSPLDFVFLSFLKRGSDKRGSDVVLHNWLDYITLSTFQWNSYFSFSASTNVSCIKRCYLHITQQYYWMKRKENTFIKWESIYDLFLTFNIVQKQLQKIDIISQRRKLTKLRKPI